MADTINDEDRPLVSVIASALKSRGQYEVQLGEKDSDEIERVRRLGRRAARELGWKVRTFVTLPNSGLVAVWIVIQESNPLHRELLRVRGNKAIRAAMESWSLEDDDG